MARRCNRLIPYLKRSEAPNSSAPAPKDGRNAAKEDGGGTEAHVVAVSAVVGICRDHSTVDAQRLKRKGTMYH